MTTAEHPALPPTVPFSSIEIDDDFNVRTHYDSKGIKDLADAIDAEGLKTPLVITNGGTGKKPYRLVSGFRRSKALELLKWGNKEVRVVFEQFENAGKKFLSNLAENTAREDVHPADQAKRFFELETGIEHNGETVQLTRKEIARATSLSQAHIGNLIRCHKNLSKDARKVWAKQELPSSVVFKMAASQDGEPLAEEEQNTILEAHLEKIETEKAQGGRKRKSKKQKEAEAESSGGSAKTTKREMADALEMLVGWRDDTEPKPKGMELAFLEGKIQGVEFALGERSRRKLGGEYTK